MACSVNWHLTFEGIKTVFDPIAKASWPIAVAWALWFFRLDIKAILSRLRSIKGAGLEAELQSEKQQSASAAESDNSTLPAGFGTEFPPPDVVLSDFDAQAREILDREVGGGDTTKLLAWAIRMRSISEEYRIHEANYRVMFGSQLRALRRLHFLTKAPASAFLPFYEEARNNPETAPIHAERTFAQWGGFLINTGYVKASPEIDPNEVEITPLGVRFLIWMTAARVSDFRRGVKCRTIAIVKYPRQARSYRWR